MNKLENKRGITLVALVITIIILLILAGISITILTNNGLFENAKLSKEVYGNSEKLEENTLLEYEKEIEKNLNKQNAEQENNNSYKELLKILNIETTKTLEEILNDEEMVEIIVNNEEAIEYIKNSSEEILPIIYNNKHVLEKFTEKLEKSENLFDNNRIQYSSMQATKPYHAFDGDKETGWRPLDGEKITDSYLIYDFLENKQCLRIDINFGYTVRDGKTFYYKFQGSIDNKNWEDITTEQLHEKEGIYTIYTTNRNPYRYFRYQGVSGNSMHVANTYSVKIMELVYYFL